MTAQPTHQMNKRSRASRKFKKMGQRLVRQTYNFLGRQSLVGDRPVFDLAEFPFLSLLEQNWRIIRNELDKILVNRERIPPFHLISPDQYKISTGEQWRTFCFYGFGSRVDHNCTRCPETAHLLETIPGLQTAFFSILAPGFHIREHRGVTKGVIRAHLGLIVPKAADKCYMRIADQRFSWVEGRVIAFDDTYRHEVFNNTDEERVVLLLDFDRPMRWPGRVMHKIMFALIRQTAYYKDPIHNLERWETRFRIES